MATVVNSPPRYHRYVDLRAICFDMDDTLLDTSGGVNEAWRLTTEAFGPGLGIDPEALNKAIRSQMVEFWKDESAVEHWRTRLHEARVHNIEITLAGQGLDASAARAIADTYWDAQSSRLKLFEDSLGTLDRLRSAGYRLGLITNGPAEMQRWKIDRFALESQFDVVVIEGEFGHGKPHPAVFEHAMSRLDATGEAALHIGDNLYADIGGAKAAGMQAAWIHRDRLELKETPEPAPDRVFANLNDLLLDLGLD